MKRFENAQAGDLVYSRIHGYGFICEIFDDYIDVKFTNKYKPKQFFKSEHEHPKHSEATLFYAKNNYIEKYLEERPE